MLLAGLGMYLLVMILRIPTFRDREGSARVNMRRRMGGGGGFVSQIHVLAPQENEMEARIQAGEDRLSVIEAGIQSERELRTGYLNATGRS